MSGIKESLLNRKAKFYSQEIWQWQFNLPVVINHRYTKTLGECFYGDEIVLASFILGNEYVTDDILLHELCHCYCYDVLKQGWTDFGTTFINELKKTGASLTESICKMEGKFYRLQEEYVPQKTLVELNAKFYQST